MEIVLNVVLTALIHYAQQMELINAIFNHVKIIGLDS